MESDYKGMCVWLICVSGMEYKDDMNSKYKQYIMWEYYEYKMYDKLKG